MSPGILQLQSTGVQDVYLTKDPQINIFKYNYYRYVNFATESVRLELNEMPNFGKHFSCNITKRGHLLSKLYLHIKLPRLEKKNGEYVCWTDGIGYGIFEDAIELGSCRRLLSRVRESRIVQGFAGTPIYLPEIGKVDRFMCIFQCIVITEAQLGMVTKIPF